MVHIKRIIFNDGDVQLLVHCPHCNRDTILFNEDCADCFHCGNELEQLNIAAWTEYAKAKEKSP